MSDNLMPPDAYNEAREKASMAQMLLEDFFEVSSEKDATEEQKDLRLQKFRLAWNLMKEIERTGFPVEWMNSYHHPYDDHTHATVIISVTVLRPPPQSASPEVKARYNNWYRSVMNISDDQSWLDDDAK